MASVAVLLALTSPRYRRRRRHRYPPPPRDLSGSRPTVLSNKNMLILLFISEQ